MDQQNNDQVPNPAQQQQQQLPPPPQQQMPPPPPPPVLPPAINPVVPPAGQVPIVQAQLHQNPNGNFDLKLQQTKLPEFWGQKEKDSISAHEFVKRVDKMASANNWSDKVAFDNVGLALKGEANIWLDSQVTLKHIEGDRERWSIIRPFFKEEFATESDDKLILDGLAHMQQRPTENVRSFFGRLNKVNRVIVDAYHSYTLIPANPPVDAAGNISNANFLAYKQALIQNVTEFYLLNQFRAALLPELRRVINLQPMETLDLDTAVRLATIELRSKEETKATSKINPVQQPDEEEDAVEAVTQPRQKKFVPQDQRYGSQQQQRQAPRPQQQPNNFRNNQQWRSSNQGNNSNRNNKHCSFCRRQGHRQEECRQRMNANQPCIDANGKTFWPKINTTDAGAPIQSLQNQDFQF
jgi:hypothetical protein